MQHVIFDVFTGLAQFCDSNEEQMTDTRKWYIVPQKLWYLHSTKWLIYNKTYIRKRAGTNGHSHSLTLAY